MKVLDELFYLETHEWVKFVDQDTALLGISDHAQHALGDIVYISLPAVGDEVVALKSFCDVESVKAVSDVYAAVSGEIIEVNTLLEDEPEKLNEDPYANWIIKVKGSFNKDHLLTAAQYKELLAKEE